MKLSNASHGRVLLLTPGCQVGSKLGDPMAVAVAGAVAPARLPGDAIPLHFIQSCRRLLHLCASGTLQRVYT